MAHEENLLSLPWHLLAKKRAGTATTAELAELTGWLARHAPTPAAPTAAADEAATQAGPRMQARVQRAALPPTRRQSSF